MSWLRSSRPSARPPEAGREPVGGSRAVLRDRGAVTPLLAVENLDVYYGRAHALQGVTLTIEHGVTAVVGRNGMGKTTLCNAITGLVHAAGSVRLAGEEILGLSPHEITRRGIAYVPQGRRDLAVADGRRDVAPGGAARPRQQWSPRHRAHLRDVSAHSRSASSTAARNCRAASSRCSRSGARCCSSRACS